MRAAAWATGLGLPFLLGCHTYLGYNLDERPVVLAKKEVARGQATLGVEGVVPGTLPPARRPLADPALGAAFFATPSLVLILIERTATTFDVTQGAQRVRQLVWARYRLRWKPMELLAGLVLGWIVGPIDLVAKLFGNVGLHASASRNGEWYQEHPPGYLTRLSQNVLTGCFDPFHCVMPGNKERVTREEPFGPPVPKSTSAKEESRERPVAGARLTLASPSLAGGPLSCVADAEGRVAVPTAELCRRLQSHGEIAITVTAEADGLKHTQTVRASVTPEAAEDIVFGTASPGADGSVAVETAGKVLKLRPLKVLAFDGIKKIDALPFRLAIGRIEVEERPGERVAYQVAPPVEAWYRTEAGAVAAMRLLSPVARAELIPVGAEGGARRAVRVRQASGDRIEWFVLDTR